MVLKFCSQMIPVYHFFCLFYFDCYIIFVWILRFPELIVLMPGTCYANVSCPCLFHAHEAKKLVVFTVTRPTFPKIPRL